MASPRRHQPRGPFQDSERGAVEDQPRLQDAAAASLLDPSATYRCQPVLATSSPGTLPLESPIGKA